MNSKIWFSGAFALTLAAFYLSLAGAPSPGPLVYTSLLVLITSILVGVDSARLEFSSYPSRIAYRPVPLVLLCLLCWIQVIPWYLAVRSKIRGGIIEKGESGEQESRLEIFARLLCAFTVSSFPTLLLFVGWGLIPGIYVPFLNNPLSRLIGLLALLLAGFGFPLLLSAKSRRSWIYGCAVLLPAMMYAAIGPNLLAASGALPELTGVIDDFPIALHVNRILIASAVLVFPVTYAGLWLTVLKKLRRS